MAIQESKQCDPLATYTLWLSKSIKTVSLFLKIFLWFWLAMALITGAIILVSWSTSRAPLARQRATFLGEMISSRSQTVVQIYESDGVRGLNEYFDRQTNRRRIRSVGFFNGERKLLAGNLRVAEINDLFDEAETAEVPKFRRLKIEGTDGKESLYAAKKVILEDDKPYFYVIEFEAFQRPAFFTSRLMLQILAVALIGSLLCYLLARYITTPISKLRDATNLIAQGDFGVRTRNEVGHRRDELGQLANDFDEMAGQIENLIKSEKRLTQDISHELRSPLARMNVALELARKKANEETMPLIARLEGESDRLNDLIGQLLTLSKLETGAREFDRTSLEISRLIEDIVEDSDFEAKANKKSVEIVQNDKAKVFGNERLLRSAIENVLRNAIRYTKEGSSVEVSVLNKDQKAAVLIRDHGGGVPEEELGKLFKPFYRVQEARDRKSGGIGLGLAIAERAVSSHDGEISAENTGDGLLVEIVLPILKA